MFFLDNNDKSLGEDGNRIYKCILFKLKLIILLKEENYYVMIRYCGIYKEKDK